jgi:RNase adaptor protein for sRNA GlmZ degradation
MTKIGPNTTEVVVMSFGLKQLEDARADVQDEVNSLCRRIANAQLVIDVSGLPNPHYIDSLRALTGRDVAIAEYLMQQPETLQLLDSVVEQLGVLLNSYQARGNNHGTVTIAFRCTGGKHRSQFFAERAALMVNDIVSSWEEPATVRVEHVRDKWANK